MAKLLITTRADPDVSQLLWKHHSSHDDLRRFILLLHGLTQTTEGGWGDMLSVFILMVGCFNLRRHVNGVINMCMTREIYEPNTRLIIAVMTAEDMFSFTCLKGFFTVDMRPHIWGTCWTKNYNYSQLVCKLSLSWWCGWGHFESVYIIS